MPISVIEEVKPKTKMQELMESADQPTIPAVGDVVSAKVISVSTNEVHVDIDGLTSGVVRGQEVIDESGLYSDINPGDSVEATVLDIENENGEMELSFRQAGHQKAWNDLDQTRLDGKVIEVQITEANKGGLMVKVGQIDGFLPVSQLTVEHYPRVEGGDKNRILDLLKSFSGEKFKVKIIDVDERDSKLIVSEKAAWEEKQQHIIAKYKVGEIIEGVVTGVVDFGAFIEFSDNLEGLVHISELAWQRIDDPKNHIKVDEKVRAKIISIDKSRISLSIKALQKDPWKEASEKYTIGQIVSGVVLKANPFGAFVELDEDIHGLAHISELSDKRINDPSEIVKVGEKYDFKILTIEPDSHRLGLSLKAVAKGSKTEPAVKDEDVVEPKAEKKEEKKEDTPSKESAAEEVPDDKKEV